MKIPNDITIEIPMKGHSVVLINNDDFMASVVIDGESCNYGIVNVQFDKPAIEPGRLILTISKEIFIQKNNLGKKLFEESNQLKNRNMCKELSTNTEENKKI